MRPEIYFVVYGEYTLPESMIVENGSTQLRQPIVFGIYYVRTGEKKIMIDAGCDTMPGCELHNFVSPAEALERIGVHPDEITDVIITHAHHDHIDGVRHFKNALIHIQEEEYQDGKAYIPDGVQIHTFSEECEVDGIKVEKIGGHSKGSCIAKIEIDGECYVFCGDECYLSRCFKEKRPTGTSYCPEKSKEFIRIYSDPVYKTLLCHDPERKNGRVV